MKSTFLRNFSQTARLEPRAQRQILDVFMTLASTVASSMAGLYTAERLLFLEDYQILFSIALFLLTVGIYATPSTPGSLSRRRVMLWSVGWITGALLQPAIEPLVLYGHGGTVFMALGTVVSLFASFAVAVMATDREQVAYVVGACLYAAMALSWVGLVGWFFPTHALTQLTLLLGLLFPCISMVVHMRHMLDRARVGARIDPVEYSLGFFSDLVRMFVYLLKFFVNNDKQQQKKRQKRR
ncbi:Bax inhibitor 1 [Coemansia sp. RSA 1290]|nr:Bax inhibitor 1 [Coemansia sp. RSA 1290]KAJ2646402.1 Bax inhibitor 1 [Coemansia sp. RSA 1250]